MENGINTKEKKKARTKLMLFILGSIILILVGGIISSLPISKGYYPLGRLLTMSGTLILITFMAWSNVKSTSRSSLQKIVAILLIGIFFIWTGRIAANAIYDFVKGPQEIVLEDAEIVQKRRYSRYGSGQLVNHLTGKTEDGTSIEVQVFDDNLEDTKAVLKGNDSVIVYYYKGNSYKVLYDIKKTD